MRKYSPAVAHELLGTIELSHCLPGRYPRTRILQADTYDRLVSNIASRICETGHSGFPIARQSSAVREAVLTHTTELDLTEGEIDRVEGASGCWTEGMKFVLLLLSGLFDSGVLGFVLVEKRTAAAAATNASPQLP